MKQQEELNLKQDLIKIRQNKNEKTRQVIRKSISPSSRFLDNYFNSNMHCNAWKPNGQITFKKYLLNYFSNFRKYAYTQSGLSHIYQTNNVLEKLEIDKKRETTKKQQTFLEYEYMQNYEMIITIEHCSNCEDHLIHTQHLNDIYKNFARIIQKCIMLRFPFIKVLLKPIDTEIVPINEFNSTTNKHRYIDDIYKEVRIGAMEIQLALKKDGILQIFTLHSKLQTGQWPNIKVVLNNIVNHLPVLNLDLKVYDKEEGINAEDDTDVEKISQNNVEDFLFTKCENIKINLYQLRNDKINELSEIANQELAYILNPKKRIEFLKQNRIIEKESYSKILDSVNIHDNNNIKNSAFTNSRENSFRPSTGKSNCFSTNDRISSRASSASLRNYSFRPISSSLTHNLQKITSQIVNNFAEIYEDKETIENMKGMLIKSQFTDLKGCILFCDLPHDCYLLEIEDSKNFQGFASVIKFNKIFKESQLFLKDEISNKSNTNNLPILKKFLGLKRQIHSYAEIYVYFNSSENIDDINFQSITGSEVLLKRILENFVERNFFEEDGKNFIKLI